MSAKAFKLYYNWLTAGGRGILTELSLCYSIVYHYNGLNRTSSSYRLVDWIRLWSCLACVCQRYMLHFSATSEIISVIVSLYLPVYFWSL